MVTVAWTVLPSANAPSRFMRNQVPNSFAFESACHTRERGARSTTRFSIRSVLRSEERRVGKECRAGGSRTRGKRKGTQENNRKHGGVERDRHQEMSGHVQL